MLGLHCCTRAFSNCGGGRGGCPSLPRMGFSSQWLLLLRSAGSRARGLQQFWLPGSRAWPQIVVAPGLSCPAASTTFPGQGSNLRPLHWQVGPCLSFPPKQIGHTVAHTCPCTPTYSVPASAWKFRFPPSHRSLSRLPGLGGWNRGLGSRHRVPSIDKCLPRESWGVRGPDPVAGEGRTDR